MQRPKCPKCGSIEYMRERTPDGDTICQDCSYKAKSSEWDKAAPSFSAFRELVDIAANKSFDRIVGLQKGNIPDKMFEMLKTSDFFRGLFQEAFMSGIAYSKDLKKQNLIFVSSEGK